MVIDKIKQNLKILTEPIRWMRGVSYYKDDYVFNTEMELSDESIEVFSEVEGSNSSTYHPRISIDLPKLTIGNTFCQCRDYEDNKRKNKIYVCKHIVASALEFFDFLKGTDEEKRIASIYNSKNNIKIKVPDINDMLLNEFEDKTSDIDSMISNELKDKMSEIGDMIPNLLSDKISYIDEGIPNLFNEKAQDIDDIILNIFKDKKEKINLEVNINADNQSNYVSVDFKIGKNKMYILKSPNIFTDARLYNKDVVYGKEFTYNPSMHYFSEEDESIAGFIDEMVDINQQLSVVPKYKRRIEIVEGKCINVLGKSLKRFLLTLGNKTFTFTINNNTYTPKIIKEDLPISFKVENIDDEILLTIDENMPLPLNVHGDVFFYNGDIYLPSQKQYTEYMKLYAPLKKEYKIKFKKENAKKVIIDLVPTLDEIATSLQIDEKIEKKIKKDLITKFYIDKKKEDVIIDLKLIYAEDNSDDYYIIRDTKKENTIRQTLSNMKFEEETDNKFIFRGSDLDLFVFLSGEVKKLKELGEVYYSDRFKYKIESPKINATVNNNKNDFLEIKFDIENIDVKDYKSVLKSIKNNDKFLKLKNDVILDLNNDNLTEFVKLMDNLSNDMFKDLDKQKLKIQNSKVIYLDDSLNNKNLDFIEGKDKIKSIASKIKDKENLDHTIPKDLNANLRNYQEEGYKFFNTLSHFEFGGILADEMGLGKTIQTIAFLLAQRDKKSLVVAPTSLIYNWKDELENFAPTLRVLVMHGDKNTRTEAFDNIKDCDIVLTTYSTLRNDYDYYKDIYFDYMVIDEAQNIKNPNAQNTQTVKSINAKVKFALTGTPIENNLVELWSIFDYLMPGYLFTQKSFESKFVNGKEENIKELKKMIGPFILRRLKRDVLTELPDKIEKKFYVEMDSEQKKIYKALVDDINEKRNNEEYKEDKITIFSYLTKLRQLCLDPSVLIDDYKGKSVKSEVALDIIKDSIEENHKILLFSQFTSVLKNLGQILDEENISYSYLDGSVNASKRIDLVNDFNNNDDNKVFLISLKAGGTGLNLTSADVVIHFDPWWNPAIEDQATDRAHRFGQKNVVEVIKLIAKGTVEEKIVKMQEDKKELISNVMSGDMNNAGVLSSLSKEDIDDLFSII